MATFQDQDYWDDMREWELKNNVDILEFKVFDGTRQSVTLQQQNLVLRQDRQGNVIPYTIEDEVEKTAKDRSITVRAVGSWTGLRKAGFIRPQKLEGLTAHQYVALATKGTKWQPGNIDYASFRTMTLDEFTDPLTLLKKTATLFNKELQYRVEVEGSTITGWYVDLIEKVGRVTRKEVELGKDLINVTRIEHTKNICTALLGFARGQDNEVITIEGINNGAPYIVDNEAFQRWSENGQHKYGFYQPETEGEIDAKRLMTLMKTEMEKRKNSSVGYEVDAIDIAEVFGLRHELIMKGDTIGIKDTAFTPALYLEARAIGGKESNSNPDRNSYVFGEYHEIVDYDAEMRKMYNRVQGLLENKAGKPLLDQLNKLVQEQEKKVNEVVETNKRVTEITEKLEEMVTNNSVTIHDGPNAPTEGLRDGKSLWLDTSNGKPGILKIWRGGKWEDVTEDFSGLEQQIRDQVAEDVQEKTSQLNKSVSDMEKKAGEMEKEFNTLKGNQSNLDKITKELVENDKGTQETIKQIKGDTTKIEQNIVNISKSIEGFTTEIGQLKKTDTELKETTVKQQQSINGISNSIAEVNKNISGQSQKINSLESTVDGNKRLIQKIETNVDNMDTDVINLMRGTKELVAPTYFKGGSVTLSKDRFNGNAVADILGSWHGLAYHFTTLKSDGKLNLGDTVTYSVWARIKGAKDGEKMQQSMYDGLGFGPEIESATNQWKQFSGSFKIEQKHLDSKDNVIRVEAWESAHAKGWVYQQSSPMLSVTKKAYPWRQAPEDTVSEGEFTSVTTEIKEEAGRISTKLEKVEARTVGGENWIINTGRNQRPQTIGMVGGAMVNKAGHSFSEDYIIVECTDHTDSFYQFHLDNTKMGDFEKGKDMTFSVDLQNDVHVDFLVFQFINGSWTENLQTGFPAGNWSRRTFTFKIDGRATGWGMRLRFARSEASKGKRFRFKRPKLEKGSVPTDFSKSTYELEQSVDGVTERITKTESIVNDAGDRNYVRNGDFTHYWADNGLQWDKALNGNLRAGNWSPGYNAGTTNPTKGYHMHVNDKKFGYPVVAVINKNGQFGMAKRWLGMPQEMPASFRNDFQPGDTYTVALDVWTETANNKIAVGLHHFIEGNNSMGFHSGGTPELTINPVKKWVRVHATMKLHDKSEMKKGFSLYVYGDRSADGSECYFKNVSVLKGSMPKAFAPSPEDGVKETSFNQKVTEITKDADGIKSNVKNLTELTTKHGQQITSSETQMKQLSDEISAKMTSKQVEDYVAGVGMTNVLRNADLKTGLKTPYFGVTPGTTITDSKYRSFNTFWSDKTGRTADDWQGAISNRYPCQGGEDFVGSCWFATDNPGSIDNGAYMELEQWNSAGTRIKTDRIQLKAQQTWQRAELTMKTEATTVSVTWRYYVQRNGRLRVGMPMLQRGKVASEFQVNPADIADVDALREDIATRIATEEFNKVVTQINREIKANKEGIEIKADANKVYTKQEADGTFAKESHVKTLESKILVNERNISLSVKENDIISKINMSKETISIEARRINLIGFVTAQHIKGSVLEGVRIKTAPSGKQRWVELNEQHINLYDKGVNRMYYGFYDTGNDVQPTVVLGKGSVGDLLGAMVFHQTTPGGNDYGKSFGRVGMVHRTENGNLLMNASIEFQRDGGHLLHHCWGNMQFRSNTHMRFETNGPFDFLTNWTDGASNINFTSTYNFDVMAHHQVWVKSNNTQWYKSGNGTFEFGKNGSNHAGITFNVNNPNDADIKFGTDIVLRSSNASGYTGNMQVKNYNGTAFRDLEVRDVKHYGRISQVSQGKLKTGVKDVKFDSLEKIMALDLKSFYMKTEIERLYEMRANREPGSPVPTYADINISYGFIVEKTDPVFQVPKGDAMDMYAISAIHIDATQNINRRLVVAERVIETQNDTIKTQNDRISNLETMLEQVLELLGKE
nr:phage tail spike protein [Bacillus thuringiensis]